MTCQLAITIPDESRGTEARQFERRRRRHSPHPSARVRLHFTATPLKICSTPVAGPILKANIEELQRSCATLLPMTFPPSSFWRGRQYRRRTGPSSLTELFSSQDLHF